MPELIEKWQRGDTGAFETLFRQYEKPVFRTAFLITDSKEGAEDVLQEVFVSMWKFRKNLRPAQRKAHHLAASHNGQTVLEEAAEKSASYYLVGGKQVKELKFALNQGVEK